MGRKSLTGGVKPLGSSRIQFDFRIQGVRYRPTLPWIPHETNLRRTRELLANVKARIEAGTLRFSEVFPEFANRQRVPLPLSGRTCSDVFDAFLDHEAARVARDDLAPATLAAHRQLLDHVWRPVIGSLSILACVTVGPRKPTTMRSVRSAAPSRSASRTIRSCTTRRGR